MEGSGNMWFILPDEGVSANDLLKDKEALSFISEAEARKTNKEAIIHLAVPKFEVSSKLDLKEALKNLGVTDCFEESLADFSPLLSEEAYVEKIEHGAFVGIDEKGVTAAAYTFTQMYATGIPSGTTVEFTADRPFLFVITGEDGTPMFIGVVNQI
jgi:serine protease inhibitor